MIADDAKIGARVRAPWGSTYRVHRVDGGQVVLADLDRPSAYVIRDIDRLGDLEIVTATTAPAPAAAPRLQAVDRPRLAARPRLVLGAIPPGQPYSSTMGLPYWAPCLSRAIGEDGTPTAEPHAWYPRNAVSAEDRASWHCPTCRDEFAGDDAADEPTDAPAPIAAPSETPVRSGPPRPIWLRPGLAADVAAELLEWWHERAAIVEYLGGEPRPMADAIAYDLLLAREAARVERSAA